MENKDIEIIWRKDAKERLERAPSLLRKMVQKLAEKRARELGYREITGELLERFKGEMMGMNTQGVDQSPNLVSESGGKHEIPWSEEACERLATIPRFLHPILIQIIEESARELGYKEVNIEALSRVEALGAGEDMHHRPAREIKWTEEAYLMLDKRIADAPPVSREFAKTMLKEDAEDIALRLGYIEINREVLTKIWESPPDDIIWSKEARERLERAPDFVRSGIKKAVERRARRRGDRVITSDLLTKFRNEAMMKAVRRIKSLGHRELTFDAFETAKQKIEKLKGNEDAKKRLDQIREYITEKGKIGLIDSNLIDRMKEYLRS